MRRSILFAIVAAWPLTTHAEQVVFVNYSSPPGGTGDSWGTALNDLTVALGVAASVSPSQVWVAAGTYKPDSGTGDREASFVVQPGVSLYGGFVGWETAIDQRSVSSNRTVLSGDIGLPNTSDDNSRHVVVVAAGALPGTVVDGFTIERGNANGGAYPLDSGGGILIDGGSPTIRQCVLRLNTAKFGGGIYSRPGSPIIESCSFRQNVATSDGGGLNVNGSAVVRHCLFDANRAAFGGGAVFCCGVSKVLDSAFTGNFANTGGGVFSPVGTLSVVRSVFEANSAGTGGAVHSSSASSQFSAALTVFAGNSAATGGALHMTNAPLLYSCVLSKNSSTQRGAGAYLQGSARFVNCTIFSNWSLTQGGGIYAASGVPVISNTVLWSNADSQSSIQASQLSSASGVWNINSSCVHGWTGSLGGIGNFGSFPPRFIDPAGADTRLGTADDTFYLSPGSACVDAGNSSLLPADQWDLDGDGDTTEPAPVDFAGAVRVFDDPETPDTGPGPAPHVDIGAYERQAACRVDFDGSGWVDIDDFTAFIEAFEAGHPSADYDASGFVDLNDFDAFMSDFALGC